MNSLHAEIVTPDRHVLATAEVMEQDGRFSGPVDLAVMPAGLYRLFEEFEELVNDQVFNRADEVEDKIASLALDVIFPDGHECRLRDLQMYPKAGRISFRLINSPADGEGSPSLRSETVKTM